MKKLVLCLSVAAVLEVIFSLSSALAGVTEQIVSKLDQNKPFRVKLLESGDKSEAVKKAAGIYILGEDGKEIQIFQGQVLPHRMSGAVFSQFDVGKLDSRYPMASIVNGKVLLFHLHSKSSDPKSYYEFGSAEHAVLDFVTQRKVNLPKVSSSENVSIFQFQPMSFNSNTGAIRGQTIILSLKGETPLGDGTTFAFFLKAGEDSADTKLQVLGAPIILDYRFHSPETLKTLVYASEGSESLSSVSRVISLQWAQSLSNVSDDDPYAVRKWKETLLENCQKLMAVDSKKANDPEIAQIRTQMPYYDLISGKRILPNIPEVSFNAGMGGFRFIQKYDPLGIPELMLVQQTDNHMARMLSLKGTLDVQEGQDKNGANFRYFVNSDDPRTQLFFFENDLMTVLLPDRASANLALATTPRALKLIDNPEFQFSEIAFSAKTVSLRVSYDAKESNALTYLLVSFKGKKHGGGPLKEWTEVFIIDNKAQDASPRVIRRQKIADYFYSSKQLGMRFVEERFARKKEGKNPPNAPADHLLFDRATPASISDEAYAARNDKEGQYLDLTNSGHEAVYRYRGVEPTEGMALTTEGNDQLGFTHYIGNESFADKVELRSPFLTKPADEVSFFVDKRPYDSTNPESDNHSYFVFVSERRGKIGDADYQAVTTGLWLWTQESKSGQVLQLGQAKHPVVLVKEFFSKEELELRVMDAEDGSLLFDDTTPKTSSIEEYKSLYNRAGVHIDVQQSLNAAHVVKRLREPMHVRTLGDQLFFKVYGIDGKPQRPSGLYQQVSDKKIIQLVNYEPIDHFEKGTFDDATFILDKQIIELTEKQKASVSLSLIDPNFSGAQKNVEFLVTLTAPGVDPFFTPVNFIGNVSSLKRLRWAKLISGKGKSADKLMLVYCLDESLNSDGAMIAQGKINVTPMSIRMNTDKSDGTEKLLNFSLNVSKTFELKNEAMKSKDFKSLLKEDTQGMVYMIKTPELSPADMNFEVQGLFDRTVAKPNSPSYAGKFKDMFSGVSAVEYFKKGQEWRILSHGQTNREEVRNLKKDEQKAIYREEIFPTVTEALNSLSNLSAPAQHKVLIVDKALKQYIYKLVISRYIDDRGGARSWSYENPRVPMYLFSATKTDHRGDIVPQDFILEQLEGMRENGNSRPILVADMGEVVKLGRPSRRGSEVGFDIHEVEINPNDLIIEDNNEVAEEGSEKDFGDDLRVQTSSLTPHAMYLFATEGDKIELSNFQSEMGKKKKHISMLFIGTAEEWERVKADAATEDKYGLTDSFSIQTLAVPAVNTRVDLIKKALDKKEYKELGYRFDASGLGASAAMLAEAAARDKMIEYLVNKSERYSLDENQDVFTKFTEVMNRFLTTFVHEPSLKKSRVIDKQFLDRFLSGSFNVPLQLSTLEKNDPLVVLSDQRKTVVNWQKAGYEGPFDLKLDVMKQILKQLKKDPVLKIPSAMMLFGNTRTGKTFLFTSLIEMLGLSVYNHSLDPRHEDNLKAKAFILRCQDVVGTTDSTPLFRKDEELESGGFKKPLRTMLEEMDQFIINSGGRGWILLDDIHVLQGKEMHMMTNHIRGLLESEYYHGIPTQHLTVFATLNPTEDYEKIRKFDPKYWGGEQVDPVVLAKATLYRENTNIEDSFFNRWGKILNLSRFPAEAKGPKLIDTFFATAKYPAENLGQMFMLSEKSVELLVKQFGNANAKDFLSTANDTLITFLEESFDSGQAGVRILMPSLKSRENEFLEFSGGRSSWKPETTKQDISAEMPKFVKENMRTLTLNKDFEGQLELLRIMVSNFRTQVFESFVEEIEQNEQFAVDTESQELFLSPAIRALGRHFLTKDMLPLKELKLDPHDFGAIRQVDRNSFIHALTQISNEEANDFFPFEIETRRSFVGILDALSDSSKKLYHKYSAVDFLQEKVTQVTGILNRIFLARLRVASLDQQPDLEKWFRNLGENKAERFEVRKQLQIANQELVNVFAKFFEEVQSPSVMKALRDDDGRFSTITNYEAARLFAIVIDKSITKLPWASGLTLTKNALTALTQDVSLLHSPGVANYFFGKKEKDNSKDFDKDHVPFIRAASKEFLMQMILSSTAKNTLKDSAEDTLNGKFHSLCEKLLVAGNRKGR